MSNDTKRALEIILPMAQECGVTVSADERFLYCNEIAIGIVCNSTWATVMEFIGYVFLRVWAKDKRMIIPDALRERIKRYWYSNEQIKQIMKLEETKA